MKKHRINLTRDIVFASLLVVTAFMLSCSKDKDKNGQPHPPAVATVQFELDSIRVSENSVTTAVEISFDKPAPVNGMLKVKIKPGSAIYQVHYKIAPVATGDSILIPVVKGQSKAGFTITTINNDELSDDRSFELLLISESPSFKAGNKKTLTTIILDDDQKVTASFLLADITVPENHTGWVVLYIRLSGPVSTETRLKMTLQSEAAIYGKHFTTAPSINTGSVILTIPPNEREAELRLKTIDNDEPASPVQLNFSFQSLSPNVIEAKPSVAKVYITSNDTAPLIPIADIRKLYNGQAQ